MRVIIPLSTNGFSHSPFQLPYTHRSGSLSVIKLAKKYGIPC